MSSGEKRTGVICAVMAYSLWGVLPVYWKALNSISPVEILAHRVFWALVFVLVLLMLNKQLKDVKQVIFQTRNFVFISLSAVVITINWGLYIWAVNSNHIVEASLGYYINPLIVVFMGVVFFKERLDIFQITAFLSAFTGVGILTVRYGRMPWISFALALSFGFYGALKKTIKISSIIGLALETAIVAPFMILFIVYRQVIGLGALGNVSVGKTLLLFFSGVVTAVPLILFAKGAKRISLSTLGFTQYISPTLSLLLGVFIFHEEFTAVHGISFGFIWSGLLIYSISQTNFCKRKFSFDKDEAA